MISSENILSVIATYEANGWVLRRLIARSERLTEFEAIAVRYAPAVKVCEGKMDAAWFSRPPAEGLIAWELRALDEAPYALLEFLDESSDDLEERISEVETRLAESTVGKEIA
ncbi:MAG: hypothetical protein IPM50_04945 [Acidobacteriota bacterium]|nr:MAG: hypothetical protein IPM50_04945 [Acidobacteriota bacterium]